MGVSIHRVVKFVGVVLYRTWMLLWKCVIVFMRLLYSMGHYAPEFFMMVPGVLHDNILSMFLMCIEQAIAELSTRLQRIAEEHLQAANKGE